MNHQETNPRLLLRKNPRLLPPGFPAIRVALKKAEKRIRHRHKCPDFAVEVVNLPRHIKGVHNQLKKQAKVIAQNGRISVRLLVGRRHDTCSFCRIQVVRMRRHIKRAHHLQGDQLTTEMARFLRAKDLEKKAQRVRARSAQSAPAPAPPASAPAPAAPAAREFLLQQLQQLVDFLTSNAGGAKSEKIPSSIFPRLRTSYN
ncbi:PREDICTED: uncharacterized protein LOC106816446 [Priapulus caudatus]|uniref:Uncharacterized protein LOC106816446 n=1 Tax=Priapulus caudatus TaxID=37621 RepID=A0ABM1EWI0_PRICU|nr:PREDICTED: uncharacterized protein LOC106816446 [Priapulus caudatus]